MEHCDQHGTNCEKIKNTEKNIDKFNENVTELVKSQNDIRERVTKVEESSKTAHHRLDSMEEQTKAIMKLAFSVENMSEKMQEMIDLYKNHDVRLDDLEKTPTEALNKKVETLDGRIDKLEKAPAETIMTYWKLFVGAIVTGTAGIVIGLLIKTYK